MSEIETTKLLAEIQKTNQRLIEDHDRRLVGMEKDMVQINLLIGHTANEVKELKNSQTDSARIMDNNMMAIRNDLTDVKLSMAKTSWIPIVMTSLLTATAAGIAAKIVGG